MQKYLCFQPQYFNEFLCDSSKCNDNCCTRPWNIDIDAATYEKYSRLEPESAAREIIDLFRYDESKGAYVMKSTPCPFLTEKKLCRIQLEHGENFLSMTCRTYPRVICCFGKFFERSLDLSCPLAAEMILSAREPMAFELTQVSEEIFANKFHLSTVYLDEKFSAHVFDIQAAMISILQERTLTIDNRLIALGFFLDRIDELADAFDEAAFTKLIAVYESKNFFAQQMPAMIRSVRFDAKKFSDVMNSIAERLPEKIIPLRKLLAACEGLGGFRKKIVALHATFLENFLVNEIFQHCIPWRFEGSIVKNFGLFAAKYKIFELMFISAVLTKSDGQDALIRLASWFAANINHVEEYQRRIFITIKNHDALDLMQSLLDGGD